MAKSFGGQNIFWVKKNFWGQNYFWGQTIFGVNFFWLKIIFGLKIILGSKKFWVPIIFGNPKCNIGCPPCSKESFGPISFECTDYWNWLGQLQLRWILFLKIRFSVIVTVLTNLNRPIFDFSGRKFRIFKKKFSPKYRYAKTVTSQKKSFQNSNFYFSKMKKITFCIFGKTRKSKWGKKCIER